MSSQCTWYAAWYFCTGIHLTNMSRTFLSYPWLCSSPRVPLLSDMQSCASTSTSRWNRRWLHWTYRNKSVHPLIIIISSSCSPSFPTCSVPHTSTAERPRVVHVGKIQTESLSCSVPTGSHLHVIYIFYPSSAVTTLTKRQPKSFVLWVCVKYWPALMWSPHNWIYCGHFNYSDIS